MKTDLDIIAEQCAEIDRRNGEDPRAENERSGDMTNEREWLDGLKAGDEVARTRRYGQAPHLVKVIRITPTMVVTAECARPDGEIVEGRYQRRSGRTVGGDAFSAQYIIEPTPEIREKIALSRLSDKARALRESIATPTDRAGLEEFIAALQPFQPTKKDGAP